MIEILEITEPTIMWIPAAIAAGGALIGAFSKRKQGQKDAQKQFERQKKLMEIQNQNQQRMMEEQFGNQQELNKQGADIQYDMWKKTGAVGQRKQLEKAGLNPGLMYGMGGAGGATTGSQGGGAAGSGSAGSGSAGKNEQVMDIGNIIQAAMMKSQVEVNQAQAEKLRAEADSVKGGEGTVGEATIKKIFEERNKLRNESSSIGYDNARKEMENEIKAEEVKLIKNNIEEWRKAGLAAMQREEIENQAKRMNIKLDKEKLRQIEHKIWQDWVNAGSGLLASSSFVAKALQGLKKKE